MLSGWTGGSRELAHETFASRRLRPSTLRAPKCLVRLTCPHDATLGRSRAALKDDLVQHPDACAMGMQCDARCVVPSPPHAPRAPNRATHVRSFDLLGRPSLNANFEGKLVSWGREERNGGEHQPPAGSVSGEWGSHAQWRRMEHCRTGASMPSSPNSRRECLLRGPTSACVVRGGMARTPCAVRSKTEPVSDALTRATWQSASERMRARADTRTTLTSRSRRRTCTTWRTSSSQDSSSNWGECASGCAYTRYEGERSPDPSTRACICAHIRCAGIEARARS